MDVVNNEYFRELGSYCRSKFFLEDFATKASAFLQSILTSKNYLKEAFARKNLGFDNADTLYEDYGKAVYFLEYMFMLEVERWTYGKFNCQVCKSQLNNYNYSFYDKYDVNKLISCLECKILPRKKLQNFLKELGWVDGERIGIDSMCIKEDTNKYTKAWFRFSILKLPSATVLKGLVFKIFASEFNNGCITFGGHTSCSYSTWDCAEIKTYQYTPGVNDDNPVLVHTESQDYQLNSTGVFEWKPTISQTMDQVQLFFQILSQAGATPNDKLYIVREGEGTLYVETSYNSSLSMCFRNICTTKMLACNGPASDGGLEMEGWNCMGKEPHCPCNTPNFKVDLLNTQ